MLTLVYKAVSVFTITSHITSVTLTHIVSLSILTSTMVWTSLSITSITFTVFASISWVTYTFVCIVIVLTSSIIGTVLIVAMIDYLTVLSHKASIAFASIVTGSINACPMIATKLTKTIISNLTILPTVPSRTITSVSVVLHHTDSMSVTTFTSTEVVRFALKTNEIIYAFA